jgi:hypothetical protein
MKWLRYYLDFCTKYSFAWSESDSLSAFLIKLQNKNQQPFMVDQAKNAVWFFWDMAGSQNAVRHEVAVSKAKIPALTSNPINQEPRKESHLAVSPIDSSNSAKPGQTVQEGSVLAKQSGADWRPVYAEIENAIKMRHFLSKTLKSYVSYTRQF